MAGNNNSGRKCDWFIERCAEIIDEEKLLDFVGRVASGKETQEKIFVTKDGDVIRERGEIEIAQRLAAFKMLAEWGVGKPTSYDPHQIVPMLQNVINEQQLLKLLYARNFADAGGNRPSDKTVVASGPSSVQAGS